MHLYAYLASKSLCDLVNAYIIFEITINVGRFCLKKIALLHDFWSRNCFFKITISKLKSVRLVWIFFAGGWLLYFYHSLEVLEQWRPDLENWVDAEGILSTIYAILSPFSLVSNTLHRAFYNPKISDRNLRDERLICLRMSSGLDQIQHLWKFMHVSFED